MNGLQIAKLREIQELARIATRELTMNAADGAKARPTVAQLNHALGNLWLIGVAASEMASSELQDT